MLKFTIIAFILFVFATFLILDIEPKKYFYYLKDKITNLNSSKEKTLLQLHKESKKKNKMLPFQKLIYETKVILIQKNNLNNLTKIYTIAFILFLTGIIICIMIENFILLPFVSIVLGLAPFFYIKYISYRDKRYVEKELENAVANITSSYMQSNTTIIEAIKDNIAYIQNPLREYFEILIFNYENINANIRKNLEEIEEKVDNDIFKEWIEALISSVDDINYKLTLPAIVNKFTTTRIINTELETDTYESAREYFTMVFISLGFIPMFKVSNEEWWDVLIHTNAGKLGLTILIVTIIISTFMVIINLKPLEYKS